jgi:hypothetical protein
MKNEKIRHSPECLKNGDQSHCVVCMKITVNILKEVAEGLLKTNDFLFETIQKAKLTIDELLKELGKREVGNWGIINDGCLEIEKALAKPKPAQGTKWIYGQGVINEK